MDNSVIKRQVAIDGLDVHYIERINLNDWQAGWNAALDWVKDAYLDELPSVQPEIIRCKDCRWGREVCGNIECFVDSNIPPEYHGYEWFCPNGERRTDETDYQKE